MISGENATSENQTTPEHNKDGLPDTNNELLYQVTDVPSVAVSIVYALQQALVHAGGGALIMSFLVYDAICGDDNVLFAKIISTTMFMNGLCTVLQIMFGVRLPIKQGSTITFIIPIAAMMSTEKWKCPDMSQNMSSSWQNVTVDEDVPPWLPRIQHISGGLILASLVEVFLGFTGLIGLIMRFIGPLTVVPTVSLIGLTLYPMFLQSTAQHWGIAFLSMGLFLLFSLFLDTVKIPFITWRKSTGWTKFHYPFFKVFSLLLAIIISWLVCLIFTVTDVFPSDPSAIGYQARTDIRLDAIADMDWFFFPYPGQFGFPKFGAAIFLGLVAATLASVIESIGDYYATATVCNVPPPPRHAVNRGIMMEGLGAVLCGFMGTCHPTTSYTDSVAVVAVTGMGSRAVWMLCGVITMLLGVFGKFGAVLATVPSPVVGGILLPILGMLTSVALMNLRHVNMTQSRNLMILGTAIILGLAIPEYLQDNPGVIQTGNSEIDQMLTILLSTSVFIGGTIGMVLDNIVPGSQVDRGLLSFNAYFSNMNSSQTNSADPYNVYNLPFCGTYKGSKYLQYIPVCPSPKVESPTEPNHGSSQETCTSAEVEKLPDHSLQDMEESVIETML